MGYRNNSSNPYAELPSAFRRIAGFCNTSTTLLAASQNIKTVPGYVDSAGRVERLPSFFALLPDYSNTRKSMEVNDFTFRGTFDFGSSCREPVGYRIRGDQEQYVRNSRKFTGFDNAERI